MMTQIHLQESCASLEGFWWQIMSLAVDDMKMTLPLSSLDSVVCAQTLDKLIEDLGAEYTLRFIGQFCSMWPGRLERLESAMYSSNSAEGQDAALSLKSGALMAGATQLAELADCLHRAFSEMLVEKLGELIGLIRDVGCHSVQMLSTLGISQKIPA